MKQSALTSFWVSVLGFAFLTACGTVPKGVRHPGLASDGYGFVKNGPILPPPDGLVAHMSPQEKQSILEAAAKGTLPSAPSSSMQPVTSPVVVKAPVRRKNMPVKRVAPPQDDGILADGAILSATSKGSAHRHKRHRRRK